MENLGQKGEVAQFVKVYEGNSIKMSLKGWGPLNHIFLAQNSNSVTQNLGEIS